MTPHQDKTRRVLFWSLGSAWCLLTLVSSTALASPREPFSLTHSEPELEVRLLQDQARSVAVLHQHRAPLNSEREAVVTELNSLAGGCRLRLYWSSKAESAALTFSELKRARRPRELSQALKRELGEEVSVEEVSAGAVSLELSAEGALELSAVYSAGCALPHLPKPKPKSALKRYAQPHTPSDTSDEGPLTTWRRLSATLNSKARVMGWSDQGLFVQLSWGRGVEVREVNVRGGGSAGVGWSASAPQSPQSPQRPVTLTLTIMSAHQPLTPLFEGPINLSSSNATAPKTAPVRPPICERPLEQRPLRLPCEQLEGLLRFLSYREGVYEGLAEGAAHRDAQALLSAALIAEHLPVTWTIAALEGATAQGLEWPKRRDQALWERDGRFAALPLLEQLLKRVGVEEGERLLREKREWRLWGSLFTEHIRGLLRLTMSYANRPQTRLLLKSAPRRERHVEGEPPPLQKEGASVSLTNNALLVPWALGAASRLLKQEAYVGLLGAQPGEAGRFARLRAPWLGAWAPFTRRFNATPARERAAAWGERLRGSTDAWVALKQPFDLYLNTLVSEASSPADVSSTGAAQPQEERGALSVGEAQLFEGLLAYPTPERLETLISLGRPYPTGALTPEGLTRSFSLPLTDPPHQDKSLSVSDRYTAHELWRDALLERALSAQRERAWSVKATVALEELQSRHWAQLQARGRLPLAEVIDRALEGQTAPTRLSWAPSERPTPLALHRRGWQLASCLALTLSEPPPGADLGDVHPLDIR